MEPTADQVRVLAAALTQLRTASDPTSRVQAVRNATRAVQGLAAEDRQLLVERLLAHGAPVAASAVSRHLDDVEVPPVAQTAIAQDLLGLAPIEVARIAEELGEAASVAPAAPPDPSWPPPTVPSEPKGPIAAAPARPAAPEPARPPAPPPLPRSRSTPRPRTRVLAPSPSVREPARRVAGRPAADRWTRLAAEFADAGDVRARRDVVVALSTAVPSDRLALLLEGVPPGWQRRMVLRRLLTGPGIDGPVPVGTLRVFDRDSDRSAAAALLVRAGLLEVEDLVDMLPEPSLDRLRRRAGRTTQGSLLR